MPEPKKGSFTEGLYKALGRMTEDEHEQIQAKGWTPSADRKTYMKDDMELPANKVRDMELKPAPKKKAGDSLATP